MQLKSYDEMSPDQKMAYRMGYADAVNHVGKILVAQMERVPPLVDDKTINNLEDDMFGSGRDAV